MHHTRYAAYAKDFDITDEIDDIIIDLFEES
jgi:hypothetical protein